MTVMQTPHGGTIDLEGYNTGLPDI